MKTNAIQVKAKSKTPRKPTTSTNILNKYFKTHDMKAKIN